MTDFIRTGKRAPKGLRTTEILTVDAAKLKKQGTFVFADPNTLILTFENGTFAALVFQKVVTYSEKLPTVDTLATIVPPPADNDDTEEAPTSPPAAPPR